MMRLLFLVLIVIAAWYGWKHWPEIVNHAPSHEAVIVNDTGHPMIRVRLKVDGQTFVKDRIENGSRATIPFKVANDAEFDLGWQYDDALGEHSWHGGMVPKGPLVQRHFIQLDSEGQVTYEARSKGLPGPPSEN